jgi:hypothetical protein
VVAEKPTAHSKHSVAGILHNVCCSNTDDFKEARRWLDSSFCCASEAVRLPRHLLVAWRFAGGTPRASLQIDLPSVLQMPRWRFAEKLAEENRLAAVVSVPGGVFRLMQAASYAVTSHIGPNRPEVQ